MWCVADTPGLELDLFIANLGELAGAFGGSGSSARLELIATSVPRPPAVVLLSPHAVTADVPDGITVESAGSAGATDGSGAAHGEWELATAFLYSAAFEGLREGGPVRVAAQQWTNAMVEAIDVLEAAGLTIDRSIVPEVMGSTVGYWNTKIGTRDILSQLPALAAHLPGSTVVATLAEAAAIASSFGGSSVVKINGAAGGIGIVELTPGRPEPPAELAERMAATAQGANKGVSVPLGGPFVLQELVGGPDSVSPSADYWIEADGWTCIALAEQILDGFRYAGACFPGRLEPHTAERCVALGGEIADALRLRGYRGMLNVDFVVDGDDTWVMELNVRQSAPLDQSLRVTAELGEGWRERAGFRLLEADGVLEISA